MRQDNQALREENNALRDMFATQQQAALYSPNAAETFDPELQQYSSAQSSRQQNTHADVRLLGSSGAMSPQTLSTRLSPETEKEKKVRVIG